MVRRLQTNAPYYFGVIERPDVVLQVGQRVPLTLTNDDGTPAMGEAVAVLLVSSARVSAGQYAFAGILQGGLTDDQRTCRGEYNPSPLVAGGVLRLTE